jgi:DNA repair protein RadA/Sms
VVKAKASFTCQACGAAHPRWMGRCDACSEWNSVLEEVSRAAPIGGRASGGAGRGRVLEMSSLADVNEPAPRRKTGIDEFDRVTGGGLVRGSAVLIGGDPGIGKSTLLLQVTARLGAGIKCAYITGEEAVDQVQMRARRLGVESSPVLVAAATNLADILATLDAQDGPDLVVIDSIQTMYIDALDSAPGTVAQVRATAQELIRLAKKRGFVLLLVGHVTKEGTIAGPRVLEHMVDTVLYFEGERGHQFRILRSVKNRFGATDEIGIFEMTDRGLSQVENPSALFLADRQGQVPGSAVFAGMEGTRPVLVEIQALVASSPLATPRRAVVGWDSGRLAMVLAVLESRCGLSFSGGEVYLNVAGGLRIGEPAADLAVAAALTSSLTGVPLPADMVVFGEISLSGEVRSVGQADARMKEAAKLGFGSALMPTRRGKNQKTNGSLKLCEVSELQDIVSSFERGGVSVAKVVSG